MKTLRFIGAEAFISNQEYAARNMKTVAHNLYPLLLKASYAHEKVDLIHILVENWPLEEFILGKLLSNTVDFPEDITHRTCHLSLTACLRGLKRYVLNSSTVYTKRLRVVDISALKDVETQECKCKKPLGRWARTELLSQICYELLIEMQRLSYNPFVFEVNIDVFCNFFVTEKNYELVVQALLTRSHCPLKIRCYGFRVDSLSLKKLFYLLTFVEPAFFRKLELVHNIRLNLYDLQILLNNIEFPKLVSLTLPARTFNVSRHTTEDDLILSSIGEKISEMTHLTEISLSFSILTGRLRKLLSVLKTPLKILEVANCSLNTVDMAYLANSLHSEHLEVLDLSGHNVTALFPSTFFKLLLKASHTLKTLILEECDIGDIHVHLVSVALTHCFKLQEFKFIGNPITSHGLRIIFTMITDLPLLKYIEFPIPKDCYPSDVVYPLDEISLTKFNNERYLGIKESLRVILMQANREDIVTVTPLFGSYDAAIQETSHELGACLLTSFKDALENFKTELQKL
uniref:Leucine-rich repeat-containing protein 14 n=1 Tax=Leptobrachium leishanense TaxID=445787 RepID=A0A8C5QD66_9ANUR